MTPCFNASDCHLHEVCVDHYSGLCPGTCHWATWFVSLLVWTCIGAILGAAVCLRCSHCSFNVCCRLRRLTQQRPGYSREVSAQTGVSMNSFHNVVMVRSMSQELY